MSLRYAQLNNTYIVYDPEDGAIKEVYSLTTSTHGYLVMKSLGGGCLSVEPDTSQTLFINVRFAHKAIVDELNKIGATIV